MNVAFARNYYPSIQSVSPQGWVASHLDQLKIDLMNCHPWAMQLKAQEKGVYPEKILKEMPTRSWGIQCGNSQEKGLPTNREHDLG